MKLYIADYLADTVHLSRGEHGAYMLLLMALWRAGGKLPRNPDKLARLAKCTPAEWLEIGPTIMEFFTIVSGSVTQKRASKEIAKYQGVVEASKRGGIASASKRANKDNAIAPTSVDKPLNGISTNQNHNQNQKVYIPLSWERARELAGQALASPATHHGVMILRELVLAASQNCLPGEIEDAIRKAAAWHMDNHGPGSMRSWRLAADMARQFRDARLNPPPIKESQHERTDAPSAKRAAREDNLARAYGGAQAASLARQAGGGG